MSPTTHLSQPPVDPPDPVGVFETDPYLLPPDWEQIGLIEPMLKADLSAYRFS